MLQAQSSETAEEARVGKTYHIDFPSLTADGGYYYTIELPAYLDALMAR